MYMHAVVCVTVSDGDIVCLSWHWQQLAVLQCGDAD